MTRNLRLTIQYIGTDYAGWQVQPGRPTVQGTIESALRQILGEPVRIIGAGRTDAGVHARGQVASFRTSSDRRTEVVRRAVNARLPRDIRVIEVADAPGDFHALSSATGKEYRYQIWTGEVMPPFLRPYAAHTRASLDPGAFSRAAAALTGRHDFSAFASAGGSAAHPVRTVTASELIRSDGDPLWVYRIAADGFLYRMVRTITGTLIEIARGRWPVDRAGEILASRDRTAAGPSAPPQGLFLEKVSYG